jgi:pyruvate-formate lyase-activating enzyme
MGLPGIRIKGCYIFLASTMKVKQYQRDYVLAQLLLNFTDGPHKKQFLENLNHCVKNKLPIELHYQTVDSLTDNKEALRAFCDWLRLNFQITKLAIAANLTFFAQNGEVMEEDSTKRCPSIIFAYFHAEKGENILSRLFNR